MITTYVSVLLFEKPWNLTRNASMHFWITRQSDKGTSYSYYAYLGGLLRPTRRFNRPDVSPRVSPAASLHVHARLIGPSGRVE